MLIGEIHPLNGCVILLFYSAKSTNIRYLVDEMHFVDKLFPWPNYLVETEFLPHFYSVLTTQINLATMKKLLLIKELYVEAFRNLGHWLLVKYFKAFAWFSFILLLIVLYAFFFRLSTGFPF
ncbi:MAG: DUF6747 family protein [Flavobacteriaceae bacterium]